MINFAVAINCGIVGPQRGDQLGQRAITRNLAEVALGLEHAGGGPSQDHRAAPPTLHPARDLAHAAEQVFDQVGDESTRSRLSGRSSRLTVSVSSRPSRKEAAALG